MTILNANTIKPVSLRKTPFVAVIQAVSKLLNDCYDSSIDRVEANNIINLLIAELNGDFKINLKTNDKEAVANLLRIIGTARKGYKYPNIMFCVSPSGFDCSHCEKHYPQKSLSTQWDRKNGETFRYCFDCGFPSDWIEGLMKNTGSNLIPRFDISPHRCRSTPSAADGRAAERFFDDGLTVRPS